jgi:hypothetical protein
LAAARTWRLLGLGALIRVGAASELVREVLWLRTEAAVSAVRAALEEDVVAGGGAALVVCARAVRACPGGDDDAVAARVLAEALLQAMRTILRNAGCAERGVGVARTAMKTGALVRRRQVRPPRGGTVTALAAVSGTGDDVLAATAAGVRRSVDNGRS